MVEINKDQGKAIANKLKKEAEEEYRKKTELYRNKYVDYEQEFIKEKMKNHPDLVAYDQYATKNNQDDHWIDFSGYYSEIYPDEWREVCRLVQEQLKEQGALNISFYNLEENMYNDIMIECILRDDINEVISVVRQKYGLA